MSAAEIIEQIKALPEAEVEIVREFLAKAPAAEEEKLGAFEAAANRVFEKHDHLLRELSK